MEAKEVVHKEWGLKWLPSLGPGTSLAKGLAFGLLLHDYSDDDVLPSTAPSHK